MKIDRLETHDRLLEFQKQKDYVSKGCEDCIKSRPPQFEMYPFYIFAHARTHDDGVTKRLIWGPRLTKPTAETNSMLFKHYPGTDNIKVIWMIPDERQWDSYSVGNVLEDKIILKSIYSFIHDKKKLEEKEPDDLDDNVINNIYAEIARCQKLNKVFHV